MAFGPEGRTDSNALALSDATHKPEHPDEGVARLAIRARFCQQVAIEYFDLALLGGGMRKKRKKVTITTETERLLVVNKPGGAIKGWCENCLVKINQRSSTQLAAIPISPGKLCLWVAARKLHFSETPDGATLICRTQH